MWKKIFLWTTAYFIIYYSKIDTTFPLWNRERVLHLGLTDFFFLPSPKHSVLGEDSILTLFYTFKDTALHLQVPTQKLSNTKTRQGAWEFSNH